MLGVEFDPNKTVHPTRRPMEDHPLTRMGTDEG
jgi:hypothetical protein